MAKTRDGVLAIKVHQWLKNWDEVPFDAHAHRRKPLPHFYLMSLPASKLKLLSGIERRTATLGRRSERDLGIQRRHEEDRSREIARFIRYGYPWSDLSKQKQDSGAFDDLRKPGWLPTAIVVNVLTAQDARRGKKVASKDLISITSRDESTAVVKLPEITKGWEPSQIHPIEVIDGQHRLWAFEEGSGGEEFELPVVAFHGLDISWQAYLFWTINIKPKKINASLAFDLYPLLRAEDWLERFEGHSIYRETRAQELTEILWSHPDSPWHQRINMLGEPGSKSVSQAAWIRSLMATYVRAFEGRGVRVGGLFGAELGADKIVLPWSRQQQAAFLIHVWQQMRDAVAGQKKGWAAALREGDLGLFDAAFDGPYTLLNQDQGVRGLLHVTNDLCYIRYQELELMDWRIEQGAKAEDTEYVSRILRDLKKQPISGFLKDIALGLVQFDW